jgi:hypothetical protein
MKLNNLLDGENAMLISFCFHFQEPRFELGTFHAECISCSFVVCVVYHKFSQVVACIEVNVSVILNLQYHVSVVRAGSASTWNTRILVYCRSVSLC